MRRDTWKTGQLVSFFFVFFLLRCFVCLFVVVIVALLFYEEGVTCCCCCREGRMRIKVLLTQGMEEYRLILVFFFF